MMFSAKLISTCLGIGYIKKGAGTVAALICCIVWYFTWTRGANAWSTFIFTTFFLVLGFFSSAIVEKEWGKDSNKVVIDEWAGMCVSLFLLPVSWQYVLSAFLLFRFFDIAKPLYIRKMEYLPGGWGVMSDDLLAGIYTNVLLQIVLKSGLF